MSLVWTLLRYVLFSFLFFFLFVGMFLAYGWLFGPRISDEAFVIVVVAALLLPVAIWLRDRRRGVPAVPEPDPRELLRASLFSLAFGGFGLVLTAFFVWRYPNFTGSGSGSWPRAAGT